MSKSNPLAGLLAKAVAALPAKSPVRAEIETALAARAKFTERAQRAWETMRQNRGVARKPAPVTPAKAKASAKPSKPTKVKVVAKPGKGKVSPSAQAAH